MFEQFPSVWEIGKSGLKYCYKMLVIFSNLFYFDFFFLFCLIFSKRCVCGRAGGVQAKKMNIQSSGQSGRKGNNDTPDENVSGKNRENVRQ